MFTRNTALWSLPFVAALLVGQVFAAQGAPVLLTDAGVIKDAGVAQDAAFVVRSRTVRVDTSVLFDAAGNVRDLGVVPEI